MPDHVHSIVWFPQTGQLSGLMHGWKRKPSFRIRGCYRRAHANHFDGFGEGDRFWQPKYYSFEIYERKKIEEKLETIHANPARAGLVRRSTGWRWSSARWYEWQTVGVPIVWVE